MPKAISFVLAGGRTIRAKTGRGRPTSSMAQKIPDLMPCTRDGGLDRPTGSAVAGAELGSVGFRRGGAAGNDADDVGGREERVVI